MTLKISAESGILYVDATGTFSLQEAQRIFIEMLEAVARYKTRKVLFDGRKLIGEPSVMERFFYGEFAAQSVRKFAERGVSPAPQFAYLLEVPVLDRARFGETVAVNRGMYVKAFDNRDDALDRLGVAPANNLDTGDSK